MTPYKSVQEVIDYAKANPGKLNYYSVGIGSTSHLSTVLFMDVTGTKMQHVPYSQMSQGITDLMSGRTEINFGPMGSSIANIRSGKHARAGAERAGALQAVARHSDLDGGRHQDGRGVRAGTASSRRRARRRRSSTRSTRICRPSSTCRTCGSARSQLGYRYIGGPPEKLAAYLKSDIAKWQTLDKKGAFK